MKSKDRQMLTTFVRNDSAVIDRPDDFGAMLKMLGVLAVLDMMAVYYYGKRALLVAITAAAVCWAADIFCLVLRRKPLHLHDISAVVTGLAIAAMLPASVPYTVAAAASVFAICIAKHPFGGHGCEIFNCAAAGYIFAELCFPQAVLSYPRPFAPLSAANIVEESLTGSFTSAAMNSSSASYSELELLIGKFPGPMGCTFTVLVIVCAAVLMCSKAISPSVFLTELSAVLLWSFLTDGAFGVITALSGGMLVFGIMFLSCGGTVPKAMGQRIIFGLASAATIIVISEISNLENPVVYASVIAAPLAHISKRNSGIIQRRKRLRRIFRSAGSDIGETIAMIGDGYDNSRK